MVLDVPTHQKRVQWIYEKFGMKSGVEIEQLINPSIDELEYVLKRLTLSYSHPQKLHGVIMNIDWYILLHTIDFTKIRFYPQKICLFSCRADDWEDALLDARVPINPLPGLAYPVKDDTNGPAKKLVGFLTKVSNVSSREFAHE